MTKKKTIIYQVVKNDIELDGGLLAIDAWDTKKLFNNDGEGRCLGYVTPDGEFVHTNSSFMDLECANVQIAILRAKAAQLEKKQKLVDEVIEDLKRQFDEGDYTVLEGLLVLMPGRSLVEALNEDEWKKYPEHFQPKVTFTRTKKKKFKGAILTPVYYQPELDNKGIKGHPGKTIFSFEVWRSKENLMKKFPKCNPLEYYGNDIEKPTYMD